MEEKQRAARKQNEALGVIHKPRYFNTTLDPFSNENMYEFNHSYWTKRKNLDYSDMPDLF